MTNSFRFDILLLLFGGIIGLLGMIGRFNHVLSFDSYVSISMFAFMMILFSHVIKSINKIESKLAGDSV